MSINNAIISDWLRQYAEAIRPGANRFKVKAYRRTAETIELLDTQVTEFLARGGNRRAWLEPQDILNTLSLTKLRKLLRR